MKMQDFECQSHRNNRGSRTKHCPFVVFENAREFHLAFYTQIPSSVLKNDNPPLTTTSKKAGNLESRPPAFKSGGNDGNRTRVFSLEG